MNNCVSDKTQLKEDEKQIKRAAEAQKQREAAKAAKQQLLVETDNNVKPEFDVSLPSPDLPLAELSGEDVNSVLSLDAAAVTSILPPTDIDDVLGLPGVVTDSIYSFLVYFTRS